MKPRNKLTTFLLVFLTTVPLTGLNFAAGLEKGTPIMQPEIGNAESKPESATNEIVEIKPEDFRPAFTRDTVIKLNSIVNRSYSLIGEFDQFRKELRISSGNSQHTPLSTKQLSESQRAAIRSMSARSQAALNDMHAAAKELEASDELYNSAVLAGMMIFVQTVEQEVSRFQQSTQRS